MILLIEYVLKNFLGKNFRIILSLVIVLFYIFLIDFPPGAVRAYILFALVKLCYFTKKRYSAIDALLFAAFIILIYNPYSIYSTGFILSFSSTLGIVLLYSRIKGRGRIKNAFKLSLCTYIINIPILVNTFNTVYFRGIILNVLLAPIYTIVIFLGFFGSILGIFYSGFNIFLQVCNILLGFSTGILETISKFSINFYIGDFGFALIVLYYLGVLVFFGYISLLDFGPITKAIYFYSIISIVFILVCSNPIREIDFIYIGQGDSAVINYEPSIFIVDAGGSRSEDYNPTDLYLIPYLKSKGINRIDGVFLSHFDADHSGGIYSLLSNFTVEGVYISEDAPKNEDYYRILELVPLYVFNGKIDLVGDDYILAIKNSTMGDENDNSLVMEVSINNFKTLFTGDIGFSREVDIINSVDILKVPHHGSKNSTSSEFLERIKPKAAIISAGIDNFYNHPSEEVLERLREKNIDTFNTRDMGRIKVDFNSGSISGYLDEKFEIDYVIIGGVLEGLFLLFFRDELQRFYKWKLFGGIYSNRS